MLKLQFSKPHFHTYNEGKTTICVYDCNVVDKENKTIITSFKVTGKATCSEKDAMNPAVGRMVADSKAKHQAYKTAQSLWSKCTICKMYEELDKIMAIVSFYEQMHFLKKNEENHIEELYNV